MKMWLIVVWFVCMTSAGKGHLDATVKVPVEPDEHTPTIVRPTVALTVIFENNSGEPVELYWDDGKDGVLQRALEHRKDASVNTFAGHTFYFTPKGSSGSKANVLHQVTIEEHTGLVMLFDTTTMKEQTKTQEREAWMKAYFEKTGRPWMNYYPRDPIIHHYYDAQHNGQSFKARSNESQFKICSADDLSADDVAQLDAMEEAYNAQQCEAGDVVTTANAKDYLSRMFYSVLDFFWTSVSSEPLPSRNAKLPPSFQIESERFFIGMWFTFKSHVKDRSTLYLHAA